MPCLTYWCPGKCSDSLGSIPDAAPSDSAGIDSGWIGAYLLSPHLGWFPAGVHITLFPIILIVIGLAFLFRPKRARHERMRMGNFASSQYNSTDGVLHSENTFSGIRQVVLDEFFKGGTIQNSFGGTIIDLRRTTLPEGETFLDIDCTFGGIEIYVPSDWKVVFRCNTCLGGCQRQTFWWRCDRPEPDIGHPGRLDIRRY